MRWVLTAPTSRASCCGAWRDRIAAGAAALTVLFLFVVFSVLVYAIRAIAKARRTSERTDRETPFVALGDDQVKAWL